MLILWRTSVDSIQGTDLTILFDQDRTGLLGQAVARELMASTSLRPKLWSRVNAPINANGYLADGGKMAHVELRWTCSNAGNTLIFFTYRSEYGIIYRTEL